MKGSAVTLLAKPPTRRASPVERFRERLERQDVDAVVRTPARRPGIGAYRDAEAARSADCSLDAIGARCPHMHRDVATRIVEAWPELVALGVEHLDVFGSEARGTSGPTSDVDVLVHFRDRATLRGLVAIRDRLSELLGRPVDVLTPGALERRPLLRERVLREAVRVA